MRARARSRRVRRAEEYSVELKQLCTGMCTARMIRAGGGFLACPVPSCASWGQCGPRRGTLRDDSALADEMTKSGENGGHSPGGTCPSPSFARTGFSQFFTFRASFSLRPEAVRLQPVARVEHHAGKLSPRVGFIMLGD